MASMKAAKAAKHVRGKIRHMIIKPAAKPGTYTSEVSRERPPQPSNGPYMPERDEPPTIHPSMNHLKAHIAATMAPPGGEGEPDQDDQPQQA